MLPAGGASYVRGGKGEKIERLYREARAPRSPHRPLCSLRTGSAHSACRLQVRAYAIPGGSEEIMQDLAVRQAAKQWEITQKVIKKARNLLLPLRPRPSRNLSC